MVSAADTATTVVQVSTYAAMKRASTIVRPASPAALLTTDR